MNRSVSIRAFGKKAVAFSWEEIWESGPYFDRVSELLEEAKGYVIVVGWQLDSRLPLKNSNGQIETLLQKVLRLCDKNRKLHFYFLYWDHSLFYVFERERWQARIWEDAHSQVHFVFDNLHPIGGSHHEKVCIFDGKVALCGGVDLCDERWDSRQHLYDDPRRSLNWDQETHGPYHDFAVQITGPICAEIQKNIAQRWTLLSSIRFPEPVKFGENFPQGHSVYLSRTAHQRFLNRPKLVRQVEFLFRDLVKLAKFRIILEGQYYWSKMMNDILLAKIYEMQGTSFEVYLILSELTSVNSPTRLMASYQARLIYQLELAAKSSGVKLVVGYPFIASDIDNPSRRSKSIYVHSKILVVDDRFLSIGSANFAARALRVDTETHLTLEAHHSFEHHHIARVGDEILAHWRIGSAAHSGTGGGIFLRRAYTYQDLQKNSACLLHRLDVLFDPPLPWLFSVVWKFRRMVAKRRLNLAAIFLCAWLAGTWTVWVLTASKSGSSGVHFIYCGIFNLTWLVPTPYFTAAFFASIQVGRVAALESAVYSVWVSSFFALAWGRSLPDLMASFQFCNGAEPGIKKLRERKFSSLVDVLLDPLMDLHCKLMGLGLQSVFLPWLLFSFGILLPSTVYCFCRWLVPVFYWLTPDIFVRAIEKWGEIVLLFASTPTIYKIWKKFLSRS